MLQGSAGCCNALQCAALQCQPTLSPPHLLRHSICQHLMMQTVAPGPQTSIGLMQPGPDMPPRDFSANWLNMSMLCCVPSWVPISWGCHGFCRFIGRVYSTSWSLGFHSSRSRFPPIGIVLQGCVACSGKCEWSAETNAEWEPNPCSTRMHTCMLFLMTCRDLHVAVLGGGGGQLVHKSSDVPRRTTHQAATTQLQGSAGMGSAVLCSQHKEAM